MFLKAYAEPRSGRTANAGGSTPPKSVPARNRRATPAVYNPPVGRSTSPRGQAYTSHYARGR